MTASSLVHRVCLFLVALLAVGPVLASTPGITVVVNGTPLELEVPPRKVDGHVVAPIEPVVKRMGARVEWDENSRILRIHYTPDPGEPTRARVVAVFDGDTLKVTRLGGAVLPSPVIRLIGVNAPETSGEERSLGVRAKKFASQQLGGETVWLSRDVSQVDRYGRSLRYVWLRPPPEDPSTRFAENHMVNALLVSQGFARAATYPPDVRHAGVFRRLERRARKAGRGLWGEEWTGSSPGDASASADTGAAYRGPYDPMGPDRDCGDFSRRAEAQAFFEAAGGPGRDPHRLDRDKDGRACESLP